MGIFSKFKLRKAVPDIVNLDQLIETLVARDFEQVIIYYQVTKLSSSVRWKKITPNKQFNSDYPFKRINVEQLEGMTEKQIRQRVYYIARLYEL